MAIDTSTYGKSTGSSILGLKEQTEDVLQWLEEYKKQILFDLRCCCPAIIKSIQYDEMTVSVQPVIKEKIKFGTQEVQEMQLPEIFNVPLVYLSAGDISVTFPVHINDECLLFFADTCIDSWWQSGGVQSQFEERRHDMSDCFCLPCKMSQPNKITDFNKSEVEIRNKNKRLSVSEDAVKIDGKDIEKHTHTVSTHAGVYITSTMIL